MINVKSIFFNPINFVSLSNLKYRSHIKFKLNSKQIIFEENKMIISHSPNKLHKRLNSLGICLDSQKELVTRETFKALKKRPEQLKSLTIIVKLDLTTSISNLNTKITNLFLSFSKELIKLQSLKSLTLKVVGKDVIVGKPQKSCLLKLIETISKLRSLNDLTLKFVPLIIMLNNEKEFVLKWGNTMASFKNLRSLNLQFYNMDHSNFLSNFSKLKHLKSVVLNINLPHDQSYKNMFENLTQLENLELDLSCHRFHVDQFQKIKDLFHNVPCILNLRKLDMNIRLNRGMHPKTLEEFSSIISKLDQLKSFSLDITENMLREGSLIIISNLVSNLKNLSELKLKYGSWENNVSESEFTSLIRNLPQNLSSLYLNFDKSRFHFDPQVCKSFVEYLNERDFELKKLHLNFYMTASLDNQSLIKLGNSINQNKKLETLFIDFSHGNCTFDAIGMTSFVIGLQDKKHMEVLQLHFKYIKNVFNGELALRLSESLINMRSLNVFDVAFEDTISSMEQKNKSIIIILKTLNYLLNLEFIGIQIMSSATPVANNIKRRLISCMKALKKLKNIVFFHGGKFMESWEDCLDISRRFSINLCLSPSFDVYTSIY